MGSRVFIVWSHELFYELVHVLLEHPGVEEVGASSQRATLRAEITNLRPDNIIIEGACMKAETFRILESCPWNPRVIRLSLQDNELIVYHREQRTVEQADDLLLLLQDD